MKTRKYEKQWLIQPLQFLDGKLRHGEVLLPTGAQPFSTRARAGTPQVSRVLSPRLFIPLRSWLTGVGRRPPGAEPAAPAVALASSISILDLARRSLRSKSRCFCSRSASRSVTCFCMSASFWRSSVIWGQRQREGCVRVNVQGSKLLGRKQQAGQQGHRAQPRPWLSPDFSSPPRYLLLVLLLHGPEMLVPLLVHFKQLWGESAVSRRQAQKYQRANCTHTSSQGARREWEQVVPTDTASVPSFPEPQHCSEVHLYQLPHVILAGTRLTPNTETVFKLGVQL